MSIVGLIPARGGSKGIPGKNIALLHGKPLLTYTAEQALKAKCLSRIILSTDDEKIAQIGSDSGIEVPFLRPAELSNDTASSLDVISHTLGWLEALGEDIEGIVLLQPTSPLRTAFQIDEAVARFRKTNADTVVSIIEVPHRFHPESLMRIQEDELVPLNSSDAMIFRRQDMPKLYARNGPAILVTRPQQIRSGALYTGRTIPYEMPAADSLDIDSQEDLDFAELILKSRLG